jgi:hypothetical protein
MKWKKIRILKKIKQECARENLRWDVRWVFSDAWIFMQYYVICLPIHSFILYKVSNLSS